MRRLLLLAAFLFFAAGVNIYSQTMVNPGDGTLSTAIAAANSGDVLQLVPGAEYTESTLFNLGTLHKAITIELADPTATQKAVVKVLASDGGTTVPNFFMIGDSGSISLSGIEFDGTQNGAATVNHLVQVTVGTTTDSGFVHKISVDNCFVHDLTGNVIDASNSTLKGIMVVDTVLINNCIFHNTYTSAYMKTAGCDYIKVTNSTFYDMNSYGLRVAGPGESGWYNHTAGALIDHTTWYNIGGTDPREVILLEKGPNLNPWTVTNTIIQNQNSTSKTVINIKMLTDTTMQNVSNVCLWQVGKVTWNGGTIKDTITMDPQFADPTKGDFTLPKGSILLTYGTDGKAIGDPRWATNGPTAVENVHNVPAKFELSQNYPNPFNPSTQINFSLQKSGMTSLIVYNLLGQEVATLIKGNLTAGQHSVSFNAVNLPTGVYIYKLNSSNQTFARKMILIK